jgi:Negative regulator of sigma F
LADESSASTIPSGKPRHSSAAKRQADASRRRTSGPPDRLVAIRPDGVHLGDTLRCIATLVLRSVPLAVMLRRAALLRPVAATLAGALAVAAVTSSALALMHDLDATAMIFIWNLGTGALIAMLVGAFGARTLRRGPAPGDTLPASRINRCDPRRALVLQGK